MPLDFESDARRIAAQEGIDPEIFLKLLDQESKGNQHARSSKGAMGLGQLMPGTAREMGVTNPHDPIQNMTGSAKYLKKMLDMFKGDMRTALAAYNAGPGNVRKYGGIPPFPETQKYVDQLMPQPLENAKPGDAAISPSTMPTGPGGGSWWDNLEPLVNQFKASQYTGNGLSAMPFGLGGGQQTEEMPGEVPVDEQDPTEMQAPPPDVVAQMPNDRQLESMGLLSRMGKDPREEPSTKNKIFQAGLPALAGALSMMFGKHSGGRDILGGLAGGFAGGRLDAANQRHKLQFEQQQGLLQAARENFKALSGLNLDQLKDHAPMGALQSVQGAWDKFSQALADDKITPKEAKELNEAWGTVSGLMSGLKATQGAVEADATKGISQGLADERFVQDVKPALAGEFDDQQGAISGRDYEQNPISAANPDEVMAAPPVQDMDKLLGEAAKRRISQKRLQEATGIPMRDAQGNFYYGQPKDVNAAAKLELDTKKARDAAKIAMARVAATDRKTDAYLKSLDQRKRDSIMNKTVANIMSLGMDPIEAFNAAMDAIMATQGLNGPGGSDQMNPPPGGTPPAPSGSSVGKYTFRPKQ